MVSHPIFLSFLKESTGDPTVPSRGGLDFDAPGSESSLHLFFSLCNFPLAHTAASILLFCPHTRDLVLSYEYYSVTVF